MNRGFTLLEILVALAVLGIFTLALLGFTQGTLQASQVVRSQATLSEEIKDAAGYLADTLQEARSLINASAPVNVNGSPCSLPTCLAAAFPEDGGTCTLRAYRLEPRSGIGVDYKNPDSFADAYTYMLLEYRLSAQACTANALSGATPYTVLDLVDRDPALSFFSTQTLPRVGITLNIRLKARAGSRVLYAPQAGGSYTVRIYPRNLP